MVSPYSDWSVSLPPPAKVLSGTDLGSLIVPQSHECRSRNSQVRDFTMLGDYGNVETCASGHFVIIFDGELYNRQELVQESTLTDESSGNAEIIADVYKRHGLKIVDKLKGIYIITIFDIQNRNIVVVRDRTGICSAFYACTSDGSIIVSNSLAALTDRPEINVKLNVLAIKRQLGDFWDSRTETCYEQIWRLPAGHYLQADGSGIKTICYWDPHPLKDKNLWASDEEIASFDRLFGKAVERCLGNQLSAISLSGGLDSVSVAVASVDICRDSGQELPLALSIFFPTSEADERKVQIAVAEQLGIRHVSLDYYSALGNGNLLDTALCLNNYTAEPLDNIWTPIYSSLRRLGAEQGVKTVLTGGGGDEWLSVSPQYAADLLRKLELGNLVKFISGIRKSFKLPLMKMLWSVLWSFGLRSILRDRILLGNYPFRDKLTTKFLRKRFDDRWPGWLAKNINDENQIFISHVKRIADIIPGSYYFTEIRKALYHPLISREMEELVFLSREDGVRIRQPYWDADLVTLLYRIKPEKLFKDGFSKGLVRSTIAKKFPGSGFDKQKKLLVANFFISQIVASLKECYDKQNHLMALADYGIVVPTEVRKVLRLAMEKNGSGYNLFSMVKLLNYNSWIANHF